MGATAQGRQKRVEVMTVAAYYAARPARGRRVKAFAYLRVSGRGQVDGDGFERQLAAVLSYAAAHDLTIARVFREEGVSGTVDGMDRPAWLEMINSILTNGIKTIVIERLDRLARDLMIQEHIIRDLQRRGITLVSVAEPDLCSDDPTRKLMRQIMGAIAEYDKSMVVLKPPGSACAPVTESARAPSPSGRTQAKRTCWRSSKPSGRLADRSKRSHALSMPRE